jgi:hypothetical protein
MMIQPDGRDSLAVRQRYLRRRRRAERLGDRGTVVLWIGLGTVAAWLSIVGFAGLGH